MASLTTAAVLLLGRSVGLCCQELYEYLDATIMVTTSPEEAYRKYDDLTNKHIDQLRCRTCPTTLHHPLKDHQERDQ